MTDTTNLGLTYLEAAQAQKHVSVNDGFRTLDTLVQAYAEDKDLSAPPGSPSTGDTYIVAAGASGLWAGQSGKLASWQDTAWYFHTPREGWLVYVRDEGLMYLYGGASWAAYSSPLDATALEEGDVSLLGINGATADTTNRLSVNSAGVLFNRATDDIDVTLNKQAAGDVAALTYKTAFSTRAIVGLNGSDDYAINVSPDGSTFYQAFHIDADNGHVAFGGASADANNVLTVSGSSALFTSSGSFGFVFSKNATANDASVTWQTNFSGRALAGLLGDDDWTLKTSPDGSTYTIALIADKDTAAVSLPQHPKFSGYLNYDQYNAAGAWFKVDINNARHNDQAALSSGTFTAPHDGYYLFGGGFLHKTNGTVPTAIQIGFSVNAASPTADASRRTGEGGAAIDDTTSISVTACLKLTAGDTVDLRAFFVGQDAYVAADENYFWGVQVA